jgi:hypothetical protein
MPPSQSYTLSLLQPPVLQCPLSLHPAGEHPPVPQLEHAISIFFMFSILDKYLDLPFP